MGLPTTWGRFAVKEQSSGWGTAETSFANANFLEAELAVPTPAQESIQADVMRADWWEPTRIAGGRSPTEFTVSMPLHGFSTSSPSGNPTEHPDALLLRSVLGAAAQDGYHASDVSGGTAASVQLTDGTGVAAHTGFAALFGTSASNATNSVGWIQTTAVDTSPDTYAPALDLAAAPDSSSATYGSNTIYLATTQPTPFTFQWLGSDDDVAWRYIDCIVTSCTLTLDARTQPKVSFTIRALDWSNLGTGGAPTPAALTDRPQMPVIHNGNGSRCVIGSNGSTTAQQIAKCSVTISADVNDDLDYSATTGFGRFTVTGRTVTLSMTALAQDATGGTLEKITALPAPGDSLGSLQIDANTTPGRALSVFVGAATVRELSKIGPEGSVLALEHEVEASIYTGDSVDTGSMGAPADTAFRVAFL